MRFDSLAALFAASNALLGASAGPLAAKRQDATTSSSAPSVGLVVGTLSNGAKTTYEVVGPQPTTTDSSQSATITGDVSVTATPTDEASKTSVTFSKTGEAPPPSTNFPSCHATDAKPFCLPNNESDLYVGNTYYATWNPDFFPINSTVVIKVQFVNDSLQEVWSSAQTENSWGFVSVETKKAWLQGYDAYNLTFYALNYEANDPLKQATPYEGPMVTLSNAPPTHYQAPQRTKTPNKEGLMIGLPVSLGFVLLVIIGLYIGMRKHRVIGLGNIMGRRNKGYGVGKSKRQRLGLGKKGAIRLENREDAPRSQYNNVPAHSRGDSLGSLVSDDGTHPAPRENQFRDEIDRQRTGR